MSEDKIKEAKYTIKNLRKSAEEDHKNIEKSIKDLLSFIQKVNCMVYSESEREEACLLHQTNNFSLINHIQNLMQNIINKSTRIKTLEEFIYDEELNEDEGNSND